MKLQKLSLLLLASMLTIVEGCTPREGQPQDFSAERPNIVFIMTDDHAYQAISAYGSKINQTPNIDRLAEEGMIFRNSFVTNSICAPSRAVILTGKHSHLNGVLDNRLAFDSTQQTFPKILQKAGYQTAMVGKWHLKSEPVGFDYWKVLPGQGRYYNPDFRTPEGREQIEGYVTDIITDEAIHFLENREAGKPFLLMYQHKAPHRAWWPKAEHFSLYNEPIPEPATLFDDYEGRGRAAKEQEMSVLYDMLPARDLKLNPDSVAKYGVEGTSDFDIRGYADHVGRFTEEQRQAWDAHYNLRTEQFFVNYPEDQRELLKSKYQFYMQDYLRCIASVDDNIGRLLDYLEEKGLRENTLIVYTSDQGFYLGEHGWFDKRFMYEESFRTPLIMSWPGVIKAGSEAQELVQNLDFAQTFLEAAGAEAPDEMQGESLLTIMKNGKADQWRDAIYYHYYEYPAVHMVKRHYGVRTDRYKLIHFYYDIDEWELFDLEKDPNELTNMYEDPEYQPVVESLKAKLAELQAQYGDTEELRQSFLPSEEGK